MFLRMKAEPARKGKTAWAVFYVCRDDDEFPEWADIGVYWEESRAIKAAEENDCALVVEVPLPEIAVPDE